MSPVCRYNWGDLAQMPAIAFWAREEKTLQELRAALHLATEEELQQIAQILFCRRFNPFDYLGTPEPADIQSKEREARIDAIVDRFRFLAADGFTVLRQRQQYLTYRQVLIRVCHHLQIAYSSELSTLDLEAEVFLHLAEHMWKQLPRSQKISLQTEIRRSLSDSALPEPLPPHLQRNPLGIVLKGGGLLAASSLLKSFLLKHIARQFALHMASYEVAKQALIRGGAAAATQVQSQLALQSARRGMAMTTARYSAVRTAFAFLGPVLWSWLALDLGWRAIATNYSRVIPTIFALAQIRLTRAEYA